MNALQTELQQLQAKKQQMAAELAEAQRQLEQPSADELSDDLMQQMQVVSELQTSVLARQRVLSVLDGQIAGKRAEIEREQYLVNLAELERLSAANAEIVQNYKAAAVALVDAFAVLYGHRREFNQMRQLVTNYERVQGMRISSVTPPVWPTFFPSWLHDDRDAPAEIRQRFDMED